jgi:glycosyltransferase involved in cell wall biosynthesis
MPPWRFDAGNSGVLQDSEPGDAAAALPARWSMVIAYYNEAVFLLATLDSLAAQTLQPLTLILVDNGSTDAGPAMAADWAARHGDIRTLLIAETCPGQVHALAAGIARVATPLVAIGDADTFYPPDYLAKADGVFATDPGVVAVFAHDSAGNPMGWRERLVRRLRDVVLIGAWRGQTYGGGYAHAFRTDALRAAGGYSATAWPYVLKDHELVHRVSKVGRFGRTPDHWVRPSDRRTDRSGVRWTLFERILYHATPYAAMDWFFYRFLGPRLASRGMKDTVLRQRQWAPAISDPASPN